ncbi:unnamed protein product [Eruca vesicaria subsp. sativa]|uniref:PGG domain-containing protein n=1 Tax=Eruca vesicaria subsp. sativa TaxID=29727 RepID=A0ABC8LJF9_ERUVS|nr:unnamed protein product [Eruca vesicaria subsp. sativa]
MSILVDVNGESDLEDQHGSREDDDINLIAEDPNILGGFDQVPFCETPLHTASEKGKTHFAMELLTLKPSLAHKLNPSGLSPMHLALQNNHVKIVRGFMAIDNSLVSIKGRGRTTPLHLVAERGDAELLSEFLFTCPSSIEEVTIKRQTAAHVAVKSRQIEAFKALLGWVKRANKEDILDWKDEDGNTVFHIAALLNQIEVMELLRGTVKVQAKNLDGETAMDILKNQHSPLSPEASRLLHRTRKHSTMTLAGYLSKKPSFIEKRNNYLGLSNFGNTETKDISDFRNAILVVAVLIATATYQTGLSPPGGFWQDDSSIPEDDHSAGQMTMYWNNAIMFYVLNGIAFFSSVHVITSLIVGLPMWIILYVSTAVLSIANFASFGFTFPYPESNSGGVLSLLFILSYPVLGVGIVAAPCVAFFVNRHHRHHVDFPASYFSRSKRS